MKKLVFGIFIAVIAVSCKGNKTSSQEEKAKALISSAMAYKTLNGIEATEAASRIQNFKDLALLDVKPTIQSFWIKKEMLHDIVLMLDAEKQEQIAEGKPDVTDGIRIYFTSDGNATITTHPIKTSIALVSTKDNGKSGEDLSSCPSGRRHLDYYEHSANAILYTAITSFEQNCPGGPSCPGASLYNCTSCSGLPSCSATPHDIPLPIAIKMVADFHDHPINTNGEWFDLGLFEILDKETRHNGIRIYFATNPQSSYSALSQRDAFIITTTEDPNNTGINTDYYDCNTAIAYKELYQNKYSHPRTPPQDNGELCPKNCN
jgi:hypothetical protein